MTTCNAYGQIFIYDNVHIPQSQIIKSENGPLTNKAKT